jgi:nitrogenase molybdenum-iron protein NifN
MPTRQAPLAEQASKNFISTRNACKLCAPLGASIVYRGIEGSVPLIHGSQGCATYIRRYVISHFKEPIDIASSNVSEEGAIFGGGNHLQKALDNIARQYRPKLIGISTTCLSETIGDDVRLYLEQYRAAKNGPDMPVIVHASTPSYRGTHMDGFHEAVNAVVRALAKNDDSHDGINLLSGFVSCEDLRILKSICGAYGLSCTLIPDYSETLDGESWTEYQKLSSGGTKIRDIRRMGGARATIEFGDFAKSGKSAGGWLEKNFGVQNMAISLPIGVRQTDKLMEVLSSIGGLPLPQILAAQRGRLIDAYIDGHKYVFGKKAAVYGEGDFIWAMASFLEEIGMVPVVCATGAKAADLQKTLVGKLENPHPDMQVIDDTDFASLEGICRKKGVEILIGNSKGYWLSRKLGIPLVRAGFPVHDRLGGQRIAHLGYAGAQQLFDRVANTLIEQRQDTSPVGYSYM